MLYNRYFINNKQIKNNFLSQKVGPGGGFHPKELVAGFILYKDHYLKDFGIRNDSLRRRTLEAYNECHTTKRLGACYRERIDPKNCFGKGYVT